MTNRFFLLSIVALASACAGAPRSTTPVRYACGDTTVLRSGEKVVANTPSLPVAQLGWTDDDADHFVTWPTATTDVEAVEYVVPHDHKKDAIVKRYDASAGYSSSDWRLLDKQVCRAEGGYNDVLARYMNGASLDEVATDLSIDRSAARTMVRKALAQLQKQYFADR